MISKNVIPFVFLMLFHTTSGMELSTQNKPDDFVYTFETKSAELVVTILHKKTISLSSTQDIKTYRKELKAIKDSCLVALMPIGNFFYKQKYQNFLIHLQNCFIMAQLALARTYRFENKQKSFNYLQSLEKTKNLWPIKMYDKLHNEKINNFFNSLVASTKKRKHSDVELKSFEKKAVAVLTQLKRPKIPLKKQRLNEPTCVYCTNLTRLTDAIAVH